MFYELIRLSRQNRAFHCYILLTIWIFLIIAGLYKFLEPSQKLTKTFDSVSQSHTESMQHYKTGLKTKRIFKSCNRFEDLTPDSEGSVEIPRWTLRGVILVIRHGDRGPLQHIRNISSVNCGSPANPLLTAYENYVQNISAPGRMSWAQIGPFHGFPFLPSIPTKCALGQLTMHGVSQLLRTGQILHQAYNSSLKLYNLTDIVVYCTRYRRTFQSVMAMLFTLLPLDVFNRVTIKESPSMSFCFSDCACHSAEYFMKILNKQVSEQYNLHPAVVRLVHQAAGLVFEQPDKALLSSPLALRDALLTYVCHDATLPCLNTASCLRADHVSALFTYTEWDNRQRWKNKHWRYACLLKAYGLFRNIVGYMLKMASESSPKLVVYSGHDYTLQYLSVAFGISAEHASLQFASRLVIEVYKNEAEHQSDPKRYYFKLFANGKDVTREISFCQHFETVRNADESKTVFCKMEDIIRFIHDNYFSGLNVTNFKDACSMHKAKRDEKIYLNNKV